MSSFNNHKFREEESFLHGVLKTFSDDNTLSLFKNIAVANGKKDIILSNIKLTSQQYYSRMSALTKAGLVKKRQNREGRGYHLTTLGKVVYDALSIIEGTYDINWKLKAIDSLERSDQFPKEEYTKIIDTLIDNDQKIKEVIVKRYKKELPSYNSGNWHAAEKTEVLYGLENITNAILQFISKAKNRVSTCTDSTGPSVTMEVEQYKKGLLELKNRDVKVRFVSEITRENLHYCKELMKLVGELRHLDEVKGNFAVSETEYLTSMVLPEAKPVPQIIYSNVKTIVEQQKYLFDTFWEKAIPAEQKIREIEEGIEPDILEVITDNNKATEIYVNLAKSVQKEALLILANSKAMVREYRIGVLEHLINACKYKGATVKIICPLDNINIPIVRWIYEKAPNIRILDAFNSTSTILIVDNQKFFRAELRESEAEEFPMAMGFAVYSNSKPSVDSFKSFFELLWQSTIIQHPVNDKALTTKNM